MNKVLIYMNNEISAYNASFKLATEFKERGKQVFYIGFAKWKEHIEKHGFRYIIIGPFIREIKLFNELNSFKQIFYEYRCYELLMKEIESILTNELPDIVILHTMLTGNSLPFLKLKIPLVNFRPELSSFFSINYPPIFSSHIPKKSFSIQSCLIFTLSWIKVLKRPIILHILDKILSFFLYGFRSSQFKFYAYLKPNRITYGWSEYGYRLKIPTYIACPYAFQFPSIPADAKVYYSGANLLLQEHSTQFNWAEFDINKKIVYCSLGSQPEGYIKGEFRMNFYIALVEVFRKRNDLQLIISTSENEKVKKLGILPSNVKIFPWVPQNEILSKADLFITHGGMVSVSTSIFYGVPMIVFPLGVDQPGNAARIVFHKLGYRADIKKITQEKLNELINNILQDQMVQQGILKMQDLFKKDNDCQEGFLFIEKAYSSFYKI